MRSLIVRAGDFFGPRGTSNQWFSAALVKPGKTPTSVTSPGCKGIGHQWTYLPDVAETMVRPSENKERLAAFEVFHIDGHWDPDGTAMVRVIGRACGKPNMKASAFPWWAIILASPLVTTFREMLEMRYLWRQPIRMDNSRLVAFLGQEPRTPLDDAVKEMLKGLGCL